MPTVHVALFHTEGGAKDGLLDLRAECLQFRQALQSVGLNVLVYSPSVMIEEEIVGPEVFRDHSEYVKSHPDFWKLPTHNVGWSKQNFLLWKPELLRFLLSQGSSVVAENDIVFYHDVNVTRFPQYLSGIDKWAKLAHKWCRDKDVVLFTDSDIKLKQDVKQDLWNKYLGERSGDWRHVWAGALVCRKSQGARGFVRQWLNLTRQLDARAPVPMATQSSDLYIHSQEQACLSIAYYLSRQRASGLSGSPRLVDLAGDRRIPPTVKMRVRGKLKSLRGR